MHLLQSYFHYTLLITFIMFITVHIDGVEAILEKYRNMKEPCQDLSTSFGTSPGFSIDDPNMKTFEADVVFDDVFKFGDAKKKLRNVLSKSSDAILAR